MVSIGLEMHTVSPHRLVRGGGVAIAFVCIKSAI